MQHQHQRSSSRIVKGVKGLMTPKSPARFNFDHPDAAPRRERGRSLSRSRSRGRSLSRARSAAPRDDENDARNANAAPVRRSRSMSRPRQTSAAAAAAEARSSSSRSKSTRRTVKYKKKGQATVISELSSSDDSSPSSNSGGSSSSSSSEESDSHRRSRSSSRRSRGSSTTRSRSAGPAQDFGTLGEQFIHLLQKNFTEACATEDVVASPSRRSRSSSKKSGSKKKHRSSKDLRKHIIVQSRSDDDDDTSSSSSSSSSEEESEDETRLDLAKANLIIRRKKSEAQSRGDVEPRGSRAMSRPSSSQDLHQRSMRYETAGAVLTSARSAHGGQSRQQLRRHPSNPRQRGGIIVDDEDGVFRPARTMSGSMGEFDDYRQPPSRRPPSDGYRRPTPMRRPPSTHTHSGDIPPQYRGGMRGPQPSEEFDDRTIETRPTHELSDYSFRIEKPAQSGFRGPPVGSMPSGSFGGPQPRMPLVEHNSYDGIGRISSSSPSFHQRPNHSLPDMPMRRGGGGVERRLPMPPFPQRRYERLEDNSCVSSGSHFQSRTLLMLPIPPGSIDFVLADTPNGPKVSWAGFASNLQVGDYIVGVENKDTRGLNSMVVTKLLNTKKRKARVLAVRRIESDEI